MQKDVYIVSARRTPFVRSEAEFKGIPLLHLASLPARKALDEMGIAEDKIDEIIVGHTGHFARYHNLARLVALELNLPPEVGAFSVHRNCASGLEALRDAYLQIACGRSGIVMACGVDCMSEKNLFFSEQLLDQWKNFKKSRSFIEKFKILKNFKLALLYPRTYLMAEPDYRHCIELYAGLHFWEAYESLVLEQGISRKDQDAWALRSHQKARDAIDSKKFEDEIVPVLIGENCDKILVHDIGPKLDLKLGKEEIENAQGLFDNRSGTLTSENCAPLADGASCVILASEDAVKEHNLKPLARLVDVLFCGVPLSQTGLGGAIALKGLLERHNIATNQLSAIEYHEETAASVLALKKYFEEQELGNLNDEIINARGGSIALGNPLAATGTRLVTSLAHHMKNNQSSYSALGLSIEGGQGGAALLAGVE